MALAKEQLLNRSTKRFNRKKEVWVRHSVPIWNPLAPAGSEEVQFPGERRWCTLACSPPPAAAI